MIAFASYVEEQADFAESAVDCLEESKADAKRIAIALVQFGQDKWRNDVVAYDTVLQSETYDAETSKLIAKTLLKG